MELELTEFSWKHSGRNEFIACRDAAMKVLIQFGWVGQRGTCM